jgi:RNA polymerase sigma-70 factor (ECF subfamily)
VVPKDFVQEVYDASYRRLVVQVLAIGGDLTEAEDAVQEAFLKAVGRAQSFAALDNPEAWLRTVALNHLRNRWRHAGIVRRMQPKMPAPAEPVELGPDHVALIAALGKLDHPLRVAVVLHYLADLSIADVAVELRIPEGTVKTRLARSRQLLAPLLSDQEEADHV